MDWTKIAECTIIIIVTWWQDCNTTTWIQSNQFETQIWSFFCNTWLIYMKEKKDTEYHRTITVVILLKEKEKKDILKSATDKKRMTWEWCACIRKKCHFLNYSLMCVWIFDAWSGENKYNFYIRYTTFLALGTSLELRNEHLNYLVKIEIMRVHIYHLFFNYQSTNLATNLHLCDKQIKYILIIASFIG